MQISSQTTFVSVKCDFRCTWMTLELTIRACHNKCLSRLFQKKNTMTPARAAAKETTSFHAVL